MAFFQGPNIVTDGLILALDAASARSYPGSGNTWTDLSGKGNNFTLDSSGITHNSAGYFDLAGGGATANYNITDSTDCTFVFWMKSTEIQSLWWNTVNSTSSYLGAYRVSNKEYYNGFGTGIEFYLDAVDVPNIYDYFRDGEWHMVEFKNVDMSGIDTNQFNKYSTGYRFDNGAIAIIQLYNKNLTEAESAQNFNAYKSRFGL